MAGSSVIIMGSGGWLPPAIASGILEQFCKEKFFAHSDFNWKVGYIVVYICKTNKFFENLKINK